MFKNSVKRDGYLSRSCGWRMNSGVQAKSDLVPVPKQAKQLIKQPASAAETNNLRAPKRNDSDREEPKSVKKRTAKKNNCLDSGEGGSRKPNKRAKRTRDVFDDDDGDDGCEQEEEMGETMNSSEDISG